MPRPHRSITTREVCILVFIYAAAVVVVCAFCAGCTHRHQSDSNVVNASTSIGRAEARNDAANASIQRAVPHTDRDGQEHLSAATGDLKDQRKDLSDTRDALEKERVASVKLHDDYQALYLSWGARLQRYVTRILIAVVSIWVVLGVVAAFLPVGGIGSMIIRLIPFGNPFAILRDRVISAKKVTAP